MKKTPLFLISFLIFSYSNSQTTCPPSEILDCNGNCAPAAWVGDQYCDDGTYDWNGNQIYFNCEEFECDGGDCLCEDPDIPSFCDSGDCDLLTFVVNTANIEVGPNGMYAGGSFFDSATAVPLYENDPVSNDGFYVGFVYVDTGQDVYFSYFNSPESSTDYGAQEILTGQPCAYGPYDERYLPNVEADTEFLHCFGSCEEDASCPGSGGNGNGDGSSCENAIPITAGTYPVVGIDGESYPLQCHGGNQAPPNGNMEWYSYTPDQDYIVTVESFDTSVDNTRFQVYGGSCDNLYCVGGDDDSGISDYSRDTFYVEAGNTYYIAWDDGQISWEDFQFVLIEYPIPQNCTWTVNMYDSAGNGWADAFGNTLAMQIRITDPQGNLNTIASPFLGNGYSGSESFEVPVGSTLEAIWLGGANEGWETSYEIVDSNGTIVGAGSQSSVDDIYVNSDCSGSVGGGGGDPQCGDFFAYEYPSGNSGGNNFDQNFAGPNPDELVFSTSAGDLDDDGITDAISVILGGVTESNYDWVYITDGSGNLIYGPVSGGQSGFYTSTDGTINVYLAADDYFELGPVTFAITCAGLSINENEIPDLEVYPNPVIDNYVNIVTSISGDKLVELFDLNGRKVMSKIISAETLDISNIEPGFYITQITIDEKSSTFKLIIN
jgi:hypothetical protein